MKTAWIPLAAATLAGATMAPIAAIVAAPLISPAPLHTMDAPPRFGNTGSPSYEPTHFAWSPDNRTLATGAENASLYLWDVRTGRRKAGLERAMSSVYEIAYSPDGRLLAVGTSELVGVSLWDARSGKLVRTLKEPYPKSKGAHVFDFAFAPDGKTLYAAAGKHIEVWDVASGRLKRKAKAPEGTCGCGWAVSPDGQRVATASAVWKNGEESPRQTTLYVWSLRTGAIEHQKRDIGWPLAWSVDGTRLFTRLVKGPDDNRIGQWFIDRNVFRRVSRDQITADGDANPFDLSPDGQALVVGRADGTISVRRARHGEMLQTLRADKGMVTGLSFSPNGKLLASGGARLKLWRVQR